MSNRASEYKDPYLRRLNEKILDLTRAGADLALKNLFEEVERERRLWRDAPLEFPEWMKNLPGTDNWLSTNSESTPKKRPSSSLNAVELRLEQEQEERKLEMELKESDLAKIVSSLGLLIIYRKEYESVLFNQPYGFA